MGRRAGGRDFAPRVRSVVDRVLEALQKNGDADKLLGRQFRDDFAGTLRALSAYVPKQLDVDLTTHTIEEFVTNAATAQVADDSTEEAKLH